MLFCARADTSICGATLLAARCISAARPLCREPTFPCPVTGAARQRILGPCPFPVPSANHCAAPLCAPFPASGALCGCACSFTFASLVYSFYTTPRGVCQRPGAKKFYSASVPLSGVERWTLLSVLSTNSFCTVPAGAVSLPCSRASPSVSGLSLPSRASSRSLPGVAYSPSRAGPCRG